MDDSCPVCKGDISSREDKGALIIKFLFGEINYKDFDDSKTCPLCNSFPGNRKVN
jgi:RNA polymerase subunit RPABC4/transcription elongation factor Spt4